MKLKKGDKIIVIAGKSRGEKGTIVRTYRVAHLRRVGLRLRSIQKSDIWMMDVTRIIVVARHELLSFSIATLLATQPHARQPQRHATDPRTVTPSQ